MIRELILLLTFREWKAPWNQSSPSAQSRTNQFRMTFPVTDYIPSFHLPVEYPHKMQLV